MKCNFWTSISLDNLKLKVFVGGNFQAEYTYFNALPRTVEENTTTLVQVRQLFPVRS